MGERRDAYEKNWKIMAVTLFALSVLFGMAPKEAAAAEASGKPEYIFGRPMTPEGTDTRMPAKQEWKFSLGARCKEGKLSYSSNRSAVSVNKKGVVTISPKFVGTAVITVRMKKYKTLAEEAVPLPKPLRPALCRHFH